MIRFRGVTRCNTRIIRTLQPVSLKFSPLGTRFRTFSEKADGSKDSSSTSLLEYRGLYTDSYKKLKAFSLASLTLATMVTPFMFLIESSIPAGGKAILGITAMSTSSLSTALIAWAGSSYVTGLRVDDGGRRLEFTTTTIFLRNIKTVVYDPMFLEPAEEYFIKVRLRRSIRIPMAEVERQGMALSDGQEETVAESLDPSGNVKGWWAVRWRREGEAGFVGECREVGKIRSGFNIDPDVIRQYIKR
ncbi:hypothetical protein M408DRAFT_327714 [Serendipita vermifera MAFF 305830]|uniref:Uncharacterized protein n=1 Tax=Serendipita vermifera MAFF 305830 TaxID=933852 RepID=A0A0C2XRJ6_SERVB|nr:hypothetical protein M408DRAFT_327714 [Serendipita vermifera MAFF 305830]